VARRPDRAVNGWHYCDNHHRFEGVTFLGDGAIVARVGYDNDFYYQAHEYSSITTAIVNVSGAATSGPLTILPCEPQVVSSQGIDYYRCGLQYYVQVHGIDGPMYVAVSPPAD
jgi:hypothetical protein